MSKKVRVINMSGAGSEPQRTAVDVATQKLRSWWAGGQSDSIVIQRRDEDLGVEVLCFVRGAVTEKDALRKAEQVLRDRRGSSGPDDPPA